MLFIDASKGFEKGTRQNKLRKEDIDKIVSTFDAFEEKGKYFYLASLDELQENDYNLNIPRYVDTFEPEPEVDIAEVHGEIEELEGELTEVRKKMDVYLKELGVLEMSDSSHPVKEYLTAQKERKTLPPKTRKPDSLACARGYRE